MEPTHWTFDAEEPIARFRQFIEFGDWWFEGRLGESDLADLDLDAELHGLEIPTVLREFYEAARRWPFEQGQFAFGWNQNFFANPNRLAASSVFASHGLIEFGLENQGVTSWACEPTGDDPAVYDLQAEGDDIDGQPHLYPGGRCSDSTG